MCLGESLIVHSKDLKSGSRMIAIKDARRRLLYRSLIQVIRPDVSEWYETHYKKVIHFASCARFVLRRSSACAFLRLEERLCLLCPLLIFEMIPWWSCLRILQMHSIALTDSLSWRFFCTPSSKIAVILHTRMFPCPRIWSLFVLQNPNFVRRFWTFAFECCWWHILRHSVSDRAAANLYLGCKLNKTSTLPVIDFTLLNHDGESACLFPDEASFVAKISEAYRIFLRWRWGLFRSKDQLGISYLHDDDEASFVAKISQAYLMFLLTICVLLSR